MSRLLQGKGLNHGVGSVVRSRSAFAIRRFARDRKLTLPPVRDFSALQRRGVQGTIDNETYYVGGPRLLEMLSLSSTSDIASFTAPANSKAQSVVYLTIKDKNLAAIAVADVICPESKPAVQELNKMGIEVAMLTGDSEAVAKAVAAQLGILLLFPELVVGGGLQHRYHSTGCGRAGKLGGSCSPQLSARC